MKTAKGNRYGVGNEIWRERNGESDKKDRGKKCESLPL